MRRITVLFWTVNGSVSIRVKIMGIVLVLVVLLGLGITIQTRLSLTATLERQLEQRGVSVTRDLAARSTDLLLTNNLFALYQLLKDTIENNEDVRYAFILGPDGNVVVHSFGQGFPADLAGANGVGGEQRSSIQVFRTEEGLIHDVAVPILDGEAGVARVGMMEGHLRQAVNELTNRQLTATALVSLFGILGALVLTAVLTRPTQELVEVTKAVSRGDLHRRVKVLARDEIGQLGQAFNRMTENLERSRQELELKEQMRVQLLSKVISAQEEERKRIARELHDETSQALTSLLVGLKVLENSGTPAEARRMAGELRQLAGQTLEAVHDLALELRPSALDDLGLVAALSRYCKEYADKMRIQVDLEATGFDGRPRLAAQVELTLYRIIQEALTNVAKHADARNASVVLDYRESAVSAIIEDDGRGFNVSQVIQSEIKERRLGLFGMQERASLLGGRLTVESQPGTGTTVYVSIPLEMAG